MKDETEELFILVAQSGLPQRLFLQLREHLTPALPRSAQIEHVGATLIAGCVTKGDLDLAVILDPRDFLAAHGVLSRLFEPNPGSVCTEYFAVFEARHLCAAVGVQLVVRGWPLDVFVSFRDRLRERPDLVEAYNALKRSFDGASITVYRAAKN